MLSEERIRGAIEGINKTHNLNLDADEIIKTAKENVKAKNNTDINEHQGKMDEFIKIIEEDNLDASSGSSLKNASKGNAHKSIIYTEDNTKNSKKNTTNTTETVETQPATTDSVVSDNTYPSVIDTLVISMIVLLIALITAITVIIRKQKKNLNVSETNQTTTKLPSGIALDDENLPYCTNRKYGYGKRFNAFIVPNGECYHISKCPLIKGHHKTVIHRYEAIKKYKPCKYCNPNNQIDNWYTELTASKIL